MNILFQQKHIIRIGALFFMFIGVTNSQAQIDELKKSNFTSLEKTTRNEPGHKWSFGSEMGIGIRALTVTLFLKTGNEKIGYFSTGFRSVSGATSGTTYRYTKNFHVFRPKPVVNFQPCLISAINFNGRTKIESSALFFSTDAVYSVSSHRSVSYGVGLDMFIFKGNFRFAIRTGLVGTSLLDEVDIQLVSGGYDPTLYRKITYRTHIPFQIIWSFNVMIGIKKKDIPS